MRILIYSMNFSPEETGVGKYSGEMARWLAEHGHAVRVICSPPYYPEWKVRAGYRAGRYVREEWHGVDVRRCPAWIPARPSGLQRIAYLLIFAITSLPVAFQSLFWRPDVVFVVEPALSCAPAAWLLAACSGAKSWLHIQDYELDAAAQLGLVKVPGLLRVLTAIETFLMRRFTRRSTISPRMLDKLREKTGSDAGNVLFPNWVDVDEIHPLRRASTYRDELQLEPHQSVALYSGNMGRKQGLEVVIDAARLLADHRSIVFVLCGAGAARSELEARAQGLSNIRWLPLQPFDKLNELLNLADVHLLPQLKGAADLVMPSKLTGMAASGRPILATASPGTQVYDMVAECGRNVPPEDAAALARELVAMIDNPDERARQGARAREIAMNELSAEAILGELENQLRALMDASPARQLQAADERPTA